MCLSLSRTTVADKRSIDQNQFFISSTEVEGTVIENKIGDALVSRIVRAHTEGTPWRAIIVVPLVPGCESSASVSFPATRADVGSVP